MILDDTSDADGMGFGISSATMKGGAIGGAAGLALGAGASRKGDSL
jgi:hypothetical protein